MNKPLLLPGDAAPLLFQLRPDIQWKKVHQANGGIWIASDPWSREHHQCSEEDYQLFHWLGEEPTIGSLLQRFQRTYPPRTIDAQQVHRLIQQGVDLGLLRRKPETKCDVATNPLQPSSSRTVRQTNRRSPIVVWCQFMLRLVHSKISLGDPSGWLHATVPLSKFAFGILGLSLLTCLGLFASLVVVVRWERLLQQLPDWASLRSPALWIGYGVLFFATRAAHELGHALACVRYGVRVRDCGLLSSFGLLCPFVDITESWKCDRDHHRIVIALGGIVAELWLAFVAAILWGFTSEGALNTLAFQTMLICSATTLLFNANPLIKYDGYFVLCDLVGIQNLREHAWEAFDGLWGGRITTTTVAQALLLSIYFIASLLNRGLLLLGIGYLAYSAAMQWRIAGIGLIIAAMYAISLLIVSISRSWERSSTSQVVPRPAPKGLRFQLIGWLSVILMGVYTATMPLPSRVHSTGIVRTGETIPIYAPESGRLRWGVPLTSSAISVAPKQPIARIVNEGIQREYLIARSHVIQTENALASRTRASFYDAKHLDDIPILKSQAALVGAQLRELGARKDRLEVVSPGRGVFQFASHNSGDPRTTAVGKEREEEPNRSQFDERLSPLLNDGEYVSKGDLLGWIESGTSLRVEAILSEEDVAKIAIGGKARMRSMRFPSLLLWGTVSEISLSTTPNYRVQLRVDAEGVPEETIAVMNGSSAEVKFHSPNRSLWHDGVDLVLRNFRVR